MCVQSFTHAPLKELLNAMLRYKTFRKLFTPVDTTPLLRLCENRDLRIDQVKTASSDGTDDGLLLSTILKRLLVKHVHIAAISTPLRPESWGTNTLVVRRLQKLGNRRSPFGSCDYYGCNAGVKAAVTSAT